MATSLKDSMTYALRQGWIAGLTRALIDLDGKPFDYAHDFNEHCCNIGLNPAETLAFQAGYFAALYRDEYYPLGLLSDLPR